VSSIAGFGGAGQKARQKELWEKDPEGCRERERIRYEQMRKRYRGQRYGEKEQDKQLQ
jgi:hypothetical protein